MRVAAVLALSLIIFGWIIAVLFWVLKGAEDSIKEVAEYGDD